MTSPGVPEPKSGELTSWGTAMLNSPLFTTGFLYILHPTIGALGMVFLKLKSIIIPWKTLGIAWLHPGFLITGIGECVCVQNTTHFQNLLLKQWCQWDGIETFRVSKRHHESDFLRVHSGIMGFTWRNQLLKILGNLYWGYKSKLRNLRIL